MDFQHNPAALWIIASFDAQQLVPITNRRHITEAEKAVEEQQPGCTDSASECNKTVSAKKDKDANSMWADIEMPGCRCFSRCFDIGHTLTACCT